MCSHVEIDNGPRRQQSWNFSEMRGLAYLLSGRPVGPTKRVYDQMASSNLSVQEWFAFLSLAGHHGGSGAQVANRNSSVVSQRISLRKAWFLGCQDYVDMSQRARSFHIRKAVPSGGSLGILENTALANWRCRYTGMESWIHGIETFCDQHAFCSVHAHIVRFASLL